MAPEVVLCKPYGFSADVYSYAIVFLECFAEKTPYQGMGFRQHLEEVVRIGRRLITNTARLDLLPRELLPRVPNSTVAPRSSSSSSSSLLVRMWDSDGTKRPGFDEICQILNEESRLLVRQDNADGTRCRHHHRYLSCRTAYLT